MVFRVSCSFALWNREEKNIMLYVECTYIPEKKINLDLGDEFNARKWFPALKALCLCLIEIPFESQLSILKNVCEEASESKTWRETMGGSHSSRNCHFSSGKLHEGQNRRLNNPTPPPNPVGK